jgi:hypothetical protein
MVCGVSRAIPMGGMLVFVGAVLVIAYLYAAGAAIGGVRDLLFPGKE